MSKLTPVDPVALAQALIRCPSVTPKESGTLAIIEEVVTRFGFTSHRLRFDQGEFIVDTLYARLGSRQPHFCFAGHSDVVSPGDRTYWTVDPFEGQIVTDQVFGRGAVDMKGGIASFLAGLSRFLHQAGSPSGSISLIITADEEGPHNYGIVKVLEWLAHHDERLDACLVGEPTSQHTLGDTIKIGRRGSLNCFLRVHGIQGHTAYPHLVDNPLPKLIRILNHFTTESLDHGTAYFPPSLLSLTSIDTRNSADNIIPATSEARFNIRFNDLYTKESLLSWLRHHIEAVTQDYTLEVLGGAEAFLTLPGPFSDMVCKVIEEQLGRKPHLSTSGGTSEARFIKDYCPVVELGLVSKTMHRCDEHVSIRDLDCLADLYAAILHEYFRHHDTRSLNTA